MRVTNDDERVLWPFDWTASTEQVGNVRWLTKLENSIAVNVNEAILYLLLNVFSDLEPT